MAKVGILAIQGDFKNHEYWFQKNGLKTTLIKECWPKNIDALVLPGGESSVMLKYLANKKSFSLTLINEIKNGLPVFATCAGLIILSSKIEKSTIQPFKILNIEIRRNGYGSQYFSGKKKIFLKDKRVYINSIFLRAPRILNAGNNIEVLGLVDKEPVLIKQKNILATTFHPEISNNLEILNYFERIL